MLAEKLRKLGFWVLDFLNGGYVREHYKDIKKIINNNDDSNNLKKLNLLLNHAVNTTEFYSQYKNFNNLKDFPIINKKIIKKNFEQFISRKYKDKKLHSMTTSGSTGTPLTVYQDFNKRKRVLAEIIYFGELCG